MSDFLGGHQTLHALNSPRSDIGTPPRSALQQRRGEHATHTHTYIYTRTHARTHTHTHTNYQCYFTVQTEGEIRCKRQGNLEVVVFPPEVPCPEVPCHKYPWCPRTRQTLPTLLPHSCGGNEEPYAKECCRTHPRPETPGQHKVPQKNTGSHKHRQTDRQKEMRNHPHKYKSRYLHKTMRKTQPGNRDQPSDFFPVPCNQLHTSTSWGKLTSENSSRQRHVPLLPLCLHNTH